MLPAYGVTIGTYDHSGSHQGQWLHELLYLTAGGTLYEGKILGARPASVWNNVTGDEAGNALVGMVQGSTRVYVFGAPYPNPVPHPGMHDVHMNQGDPVNSPFHPLDGIWQDGCVIVDGSDGSLAGYFGKFAAQSLNTDSNGSPL